MGFFDPKCPLCGGSRTKKERVSSGGHIDSRTYELVNVSCPGCHGTGRVNEVHTETYEDPCSNAYCSGGKVRVERYTALPDGTPKKGTFRVTTETCGTCGGRGTIKRTRTAWECGGGHRHTMG